MTLADDFLRFDDTLVQRAGEPPLSKWWRTQSRRYLEGLERGESTEWWACAGRGASKSTTLYKLALFFTLFGKFDIPQSQVHYAVIISVVKREAEKGKRVIGKYCDALGVETRGATDLIEMPALRRGILIISASVYTASGWRSYFVGVDEYAKWGSDGAVMVDSDEVLSSARMMTITHKHAPIVVSSTPWSAQGTFYETVTKGAPGTVVSGPAPSWVANPDLITEASSHLKEPDARRWKRDVACTFVNEYEGGFYPGDAVDGCTDSGRLPLPAGPTAGARYIMAIDPAFSRDRFAIAIAHAVRDAQGGIRAWLDYIEAIAPPKGGVLSVDWCVNHASDLRRKWPSEHIILSDQHEQGALGAAFGLRGIGMKPEPWSLQNKVTRFSTVRSLIIDRRVRLCDSPELREELSGIGVNLTRTGNETIETRGVSHDDMVSAMVMAVETAARYADAGPMIVRTWDGNTVDANGGFVIRRDAQGGY